MEDNIKRIDIKEFREKGYLQEVNRRFFHPLGLALVVSRDFDGNEILYGILDNRDEKEGIYFGLSESDSKRIEKFKENKKFIDNEFENRFKDRKEILGFTIEPIINNNI